MENNVLMVAPTVQMTIYNHLGISYSMVNRIIK